ncbi:cell wall-binding repeat-containing protein [Peptacetobacter hiranonis]|uniref:cell wall-binding repeat-containing protein n=1 Tax=Peptacetobacter hiranonis TaxID=89152 RepID=UPI003D81467D
MKKKLLSIFLSLSLIFSSIAYMSVSFAEENSSTEKVVQQDGIEKVKRRENRDISSMDNKDIEYEFNKKVSSDKKSVEIELSLKEGQNIKITSVVMPNKEVIEYTGKNITYTVYENDEYTFTVNYIINTDDYREVKFKDDVMERVYEIDNVLGIEYELEEGSKIEDRNNSAVEIRDRNGQENEIKYDGWQLMELNLKIPKTDGIEIISINPEKETLYKELSDGLTSTEKEWRYQYLFKENGEYKFNIEYKQDGSIKNTQIVYKINSLLKIKDLYMRYYLLKDGGYHFDENWIYRDYLRKDQMDGKNFGWGFGQGRFEESQVKNIKSLDGMQYTSGIYNLYVFNCQNIETIKPLTKGYYPYLQSFRLTEIDADETNLNPNSYTPEMLADAVRNMPNIGEFSANKTGFKDFTAFKDLNGRLHSIKSRDNGVESLEGLENCKELYSIFLRRNSITKIDPLSSAEEIHLLELTRNKIKDLRPINKSLSTSVVAGQQFAATGQTIVEDKTIISENNEDSYKIELPMPIDIKSELTDTEEVKVIYKNSNEKTYKSKQENGKYYIEIPQEDVKDVEEGNVFKGAKFEFYFNNNKGTDNRTKGYFNGKVEFKVSSTKEDAVEKATVKYEAKNTSKNRTDVDVDKNILKVEDINVLDYVKLPKDEKEYNVGETVTLQNPTTTKKINEDGEETGVSTELKPEESVLVKYKPNPNEDVETYVELKFEGYEPEKTNLVAGENTFVGKFKFNDLELVHYDFITDEGKEIPKNIEDKIRKEFKDFEEDELYYDGEKITTQNPIHNEIEDTNGTWKFKGWAHEEDGKYVYIEKEGMQVHHDEEIIGVWHFEPKSTGGGAGGGTITPTPNPNPTPDKEDPDRVEGDDRIETSIEASEILYPNGTNAVVLANAERFSDVLTANPFAVQEKASALLTYKDKLPEKTLKEIERLGAKKIYVSGGYEAVSKKVVDSLAAKGYEIYRFDGLDRYDTARKIAIKIREKGNKEVVELASGENYPDALCMTSMAVKDNAPILLTRKDSIPKYTKQALAEWDIESVKIGGLDEAISKDVQNQIDKGFEITKGNKADSNVYDGAKKVSRFGGKDRYETSTIIAANSYPESKLGVYATGEDFPDALIAGNYAGRKEAPVLLVKRDTLPEVVEKYTTDSKIEKATVIGGVNAVSDKVFNLIKAAINK